MIYPIIRFRQVQGSHIYIATIYIEIFYGTFMIKPALSHPLPAVKLNCKSCISIQIFIFINIQDSKTLANILTNVIDLNPDMTHIHLFFWSWCHMTSTKLFRHITMLTTCLKNSFNNTRKQG